MSDAVSRPVGLRCPDGADYRRVGLLDFLSQRRVSASKRRVSMRCPTHPTSHNTLSGALAADLSDDQHTAAAAFSSAGSNWRRRLRWLPPHPAPRHRFPVEKGWAAQQGRGPSALLLLMRRSCRSAARDSQASQGSHPPAALCGAAPGLRSSLTRWG